MLVTAIEEHKPSQEFSTDCEKVKANACYALARGERHGRPAEMLLDFQKNLCGSHVIYFLNYADRLEVVSILHQRQDAEHRRNPSALGGGGCQAQMVETLYLSVITVTELCFGLAV